MSEELSASSVSYFTSEGTYSGKGETPTPPGVNTTDTIYQEVQLYIEGVQIPFSTININQAMGNLPTAFIDVPPHPGLMDIGRYYQPKVHIFFIDNNLGGARLLFWGHITSVAYSRSKAGGSSIQFNCIHKNAMVGKVMLDYTGYANDPSQIFTDIQQASGAAKSNSMTSSMSVMTALTGISGVAKSEKDLFTSLNKDVAKADVTKLDPSLEKFEKRLIGMPASIINLWNQIKRDCYKSQFTNLIMSTMYIPLIEEGLGFFKRMSGHHYLESQIQGTKSIYCSTVNGNSEVMVPPSVRLHAMSAVQTEMAVKVIQQRINFSGELTSFARLVGEFYNSIQYEMLTLASPAEVLVDPEEFSTSPEGMERMAVETIIKPQTPFYFSPVCNVLFPGMYVDVSISQDDDSVPSQVSAYHSQLPVDESGARITFRGPHSVREATAIGNSLTLKKDSTQSKNPNPTLTSTLGVYYNVPGIYETGVGVNQLRMQLPWWLSTLTANQSNNTSTKKVDWPTKGSREHYDLLLLSAAWKQRYGKGEFGHKLNPFHKDSNSHPHYALLYSHVDYEFSKAVVRSRKGTVNGIFNPYIVPGYPMDVLSNSPNDPSFHALCSGVTHMITSNSISTSVTMVGVSTYSELANYHIPPIYPWLQTALGIVNADSVEGFETADVFDTSVVKGVRSTLIDNPKAKAAADQFYMSVLGVGAVAPDTIYDFGLNRPYPLHKIGPILGIASIPNPGLKSPNGGTMHDFLSKAGNLNLVSRPIETKASIEKKFNYKFVDLKRELYNDTLQPYSNPRLGEIDPIEPGGSMFLSYPTSEGMISEAKRLDKIRHAEKLKEIR